jgi:beta-lactamase regulating signal transducer with metallopeptidase domain
VSGPAELAVLSGIIADASLKATLVLALGWGGSRLLGRASAAQRHAVWAATFAVLPRLLGVAGTRGPALALDAPWIVAVWAAGFVLALSPMVGGLVALSRLRAGATADPDRPNVLHSDAIASPITWGLWRPVVLMPSAAATWSRAERDAALAHERAHIARHDWAVHLAAWALCAVFWFHPLVWLARRALIREAEHAADDAVLATGVRPSDYAALLLSLSRAEPPLAALGAASSWVGDRVRAVLAVRPRSPRRWPVGLLALGLAAPSIPASGAWSAWTTPEAAQTCRPGPLP